MSKSIIKLVRNIKSLGIPSKTADSVSIRTRIHLTSTIFVPQILLERMVYRQNLAIYFIAVNLTFMVIAYVVPPKGTGLDLPRWSYSKRDIRVVNTTVPGHLLNLNETDFDFLTWSFGMIDAIPDDVLASGDTPTHQYLVNTFSNPEAIALTWVQISKCALAISKFILSNLASASQLKQIKGWIDELGGVINVANMLLEASSWDELGAIGGEPLVNLVGILVQFGADVLPSCMG